MAEKKVTLVRIEYSDGSAELAEGNHAEEVMNWYHAAESMLLIHGGVYKGNTMIQIPSPTKELESVASIAERVYPQQVEAIRAGNLDGDRLIKDSWYEECDESRRLNRQ
jgi:hypothetical protein